MTSTPRHLRVFLSSPGDLRDERSHIRRILRDVQRAAAWKGKFTLEAVSWDDPDAPVPMDAHLSPQQAVDRHLGTPSQCDLVVVLLWSRMGTPMAAPLKPDGSRYLSGTEYELAEALAADSGPRVLIYRRDDEPDFAEAATGADFRQQFDTVRGFIDGLIGAGRSVIGYRGAGGFAKRFRKDLQGVLRELEQTDTGGPPLEVKTFPRTPRSRLHYRTRDVELFGRDGERLALQAFLDAEMTFAWWVVTGEGGAGKSRLALELALAVKDRWRAGFLAAGHGFASWHEWRPERPTLVIVDYVVQRLDELQDALSALSLRQWPPGAHRLRVLLLERRADEGAPWWQQLFGTGSQAVAMRSSLHAPPLALSPLGDADVWRLVHCVMQHSEAAVMPERDEVLRELDMIDPERRPLFLLMAADALARGQDLRHWDREQLLEDHLLREEESFWRPAGVTAQDRYLLALVTMTGGLAVTRLRDLPQNGELPTAAPGPNRFHAGRFEALTGMPSHIWLEPLKPDVIGEYFVLRELRPADVLDDRARRLWHVARRLNAVEAYSFLQQSTKDFPRHPTLPWLGEIGSEDPLQREGAVWDVFFRQSDIAEQRGIDAAIGRYREVAAMVEQHRTAGLVKSLELVCHDYIKILGEYDRLPEARAAHGQMVELIASVPDSADGGRWSMSALRLYDLTTFYCLAQDLPNARSLLAETRAVAAGDPASAEVREQIAAASYNVVTTLAQAGDFDAALEELHHLTAIVGAHRDEAAPRNDWLQTVSNVAVLAARAQRADIRDNVIRELGSLELDWPEDIALAAKLCVMVSHWVRLAVAEGRIEPAVRAAEQWLKHRPASMEEAWFGNGLDAVADVAQALAGAGELERAARLIQASFDALVARSAVAAPELALTVVAPYAVLEAIVEGLCAGGQRELALALVHQALALQPLWRHIDSQAAQGPAIATGNASFCISDALRRAHCSLHDELSLLEQAVSAWRSTTDADLTFSLVLMAHNLLECAAAEPNRAVIVDVVRLAGRELRGTRLREVLREVRGEPAISRLDALLGPAETV